MALVLLEADFCDCYVYCSLYLCLAAQFDFFCCSGVQRSCSTPGPSANPVPVQHSSSSSSATPRAHQILPSLKPTNARSLSSLGAGGTLVSRSAGISSLCQYAGFSTPAFVLHTTILIRRSMCFSSTKILALPLLQCGLVVDTQHERAHTCNLHLVEKFLRHPASDTSMQLPCRRS